MTETGLSEWLLEADESDVEEFWNVAHNQPVFSGDTISHSTAKAVQEAGWIERDRNGDWVLTELTKQCLKLEDNDYSPQ